MGALVSKALRPIKTFNVENRAHRVISKDKPTPAPQYPSAVEDLKRTLKTVPDLDEKLDKKDPALDDRLKSVYVTAYGRPEDDITREKIKQNPNRPLPKNRSQVPEFEMGWNEPEVVPYGRTTLRSALDFIESHQMNPEEVTALKIAVEYKMKQEDVEAILKYFKSYEIYIPETKKSAATFAGPTTFRKKQLQEAKAKELADKSEIVNKKQDVPMKDQAKMTVPRHGSTGAGSVGAASLGARRVAPSSKRAPSVRSDERNTATQGDVLNSIKFQRRLLDSIIIGKANATSRENQDSVQSKAKAIDKNDTAGISLEVRRSNYKLGGSKEKNARIGPMRIFNRPSSPKARHNVHTPFY